MKERKTYLFFKKGDYESFLTVLSNFEALQAKKISDHLIEVTNKEPFDPADFISIREMTVQEFYQDFVALVVPTSPHFDATPFLEMMEKLNPGVYTIADLITEVVFTRPDLKSYLRNYYYNLLGAETIETILGFIKADQNASKASVELYMHRNTLNYRLDHFITVSEIDVRTFKGAMAMMLLFRK